MKNRQGQALIIVVIIIAVVMAVFANSLTTRLRYHAQEETEIYQREQALYLAEMGINQMIFNINSGTTYNEGDTITGNFSGIGSYTTVYHTSDDPGFGGSGYIESTGTVEEISRKVFASVQSGGSSDAFKYCLYTKKGGRDGIADDSYFNNPPPPNGYGDSYKYNLNNGTTYTVPYPDPNYYNNEENYEKYVNKNGNQSTYKYKIKKNDLKEESNVIYIHTENTNATLTIDFSNVSPVDSFSLSIITDAKKVTIENLYPHLSLFQSSTTTWSGAENSKDNNLVYPIITHLGTGKLEFDYNNIRDINTTLKLDGFIYTAGYIYMNYDRHSILGTVTISSGEIDGEVMEGDPQRDLGGSDGKHTSINYTVDYYTTPPPHFIVPDNVTKVLPGSFREEY